MSVLKKYFLSFLFTGVLIFLHAPNPVAAQTVLGESGNVSSSADLSDTYYRAKVVAILEEGKKEVEPGQWQAYQKIELEILNGDERGKRITIDHGGSFAIIESQKVKEGETVVIAKTPALPGGRAVYYVIDKYRVNGLLAVILVFFATAIYFGRKRGVTAIIGLLFSVFVIFYYIIPHILKGGNPFVVSLIGAMIILFLSLYLSHGFNTRTTLAVVSSFITLGLAAIIDLLFVHIAKLAGNGTEEAFYLQFDTFNVDLRGLLLGGIIIGVLGVLDDVTTAQTAAIEEIHAANATLLFTDLYRKGMSIGREHIASLVNTLVLAYVGVSFPFLLLYTSQKAQAFWMTVNSSFVAEELVRTLVGSTALVLAVPIATFFAAWFYGRKAKV